MSDLEHSNDTSWMSTVLLERKGAGYFLSQTNYFCFRPQEYIRVRAVRRDESECLIDEWSQWLSDLRSCRHGGVRRAATAASPLTQEDLNEYYRQKYFSNRELDVLEGSSQQLKEADRLYTSHLQGCQKGPGEAWIQMIVNLLLCLLTIRNAYQCYTDSSSGFGPNIFT
jgi:hypothetical protein